MSMSPRVLTYALVFTILVGCVGGLQGQEALQAVDAARKEKYLLDVPLSSGLDVGSVMYRKEPLGDDWLLQIKKSSGLALVPRDAGVAPILDEDDFYELMEDLLATIHREHDDQLDSIHVGLALVDPFRKASIEHLRTADINPDAIVEPKSASVRVAMESYISESALVESVCEMVVIIDKRCSEPAVSMNPIVFRSASLGKKWGEVRQLADAGIESDRIWFAIDLEDL